MNKEEAVFIQLAALADAAALALENGRTDTGAGVVYTMIDILQETLSYYPKKNAEE